jgi:hypothetical protein
MTVSITSMRGSAVTSTMKKRRMTIMPLKIEKLDPGKKSSTKEKRKLSNQEGQLPKRFIFEHRQIAPPSRPAFDSAEKSDRVVKGAGEPDSMGYRMGMAKQPGSTNVAPYAKTAKPPSARKKYTAT